jgi:parallel beta-helix repeat protein
MIGPDMREEPTRSGDSKPTTARKGLPPLFRTFWIVFVSWLCIGQAYAATTYYVATTGNDANAGTSLVSPFKTLQKAMDMTAPGDTVLIRGGTYRERTDAKKGGGAQGAFVTVAPYNDEKPVFKGSDIVTGWVPHSGQIWKKTDWAVNSQQVFVDFDANPGKPLQQIGMPSPLHGKFEYPTPVGTDLSSMTPGTFFYDPGSTTLYVWLADGSDPNSHVMEVSTRMRILFLEVMWVHLKGLTFRHSNTNGFLQQGNAVELSSNSIIENCDIQWADFTGLGMGYLQNNTTAINNIISNNGAVGITAAGSSAFLVSQNKLNYNNYRNFNTQWHAAGLKGAGNSYGTIEANEAAYNKASGIWCDNCSSGGQIVIRNNYIHDNGPKEAGIFLEETSNALVYNNVVANNERRGLYISASNGIQVLNNTFAGTRGWAAVDFHGMPRAGGARLTNNTFYNNIISGSSTVYDLEIAAPNGTDIKNNLSDYNNIYRGGQPLNLASQQLVSTLAEWRAMTGNDVHTISADPKYVNPATPVGFAVADDSPVIDAGMNLGALVVADYMAFARPQGAGFDIGAFEKGTAPAPPPPPPPPSDPPPPPPPPVSGKDATAPEVTLVGLAPNATVSGTVKIAATAKDNVGVVEMSLYIDGDKKAGSTTGDISYVWDLTGVRSGSHDVRVSASDAAQNTGRAVTTLNVQQNGSTAPPPPPPSTDKDATPPIVSITGPASGATVTGTVVISAAATDNKAVTEMTILVDGIVKATSTTGSISYSWNTTGLRAGSHAIRVSAGDAAHNTGSGNISVVVK